MQWNDDMSLAPAGEEWVMGAIELEESDPASYVYESVIFDSGFWTNSVGMVVEPVAWCRIEQYTPANSKRDWENHPSFFAAMGAIENMLPDGMFCVGIAIANTDTAEGALILDNDNRDLESAVFDADVKQDILADAQRQYGDAVTFLQGSFSGAHKH